MVSIEAVVDKVIEIDECHPNPGKRKKQSPKSRFSYDDLKLQVRAIKVTRLPLSSWVYPT
jgi:hypothetical protein